MTIMVAVIAMLVWKAANIVSSARDESLQWTIIGALGSWAGSFLGAIAIIISLFALWLPQKVKIAVNVSFGVMISDVPGKDSVEAYIITVKNVGMRSITVNNIYLNFGGRKECGDIYVGQLNQHTILQTFAPKFPKRLESGESFDYYLQREKLKDALAHYESKTELASPLFIRVDEVIRGSQYFKTKLKLGAFLDNKL